MWDRPYSLLFFPLNGGDTAVDLTSPFPSLPCPPLTAHKREKLSLAELFGLKLLEILLTVRRVNRRAQRKRQEGPTADTFPRASLSMTFPGMKPEWWKGIQLLGHYSTV